MTPRRVLLLLAMVVLVAGVAGLIGRSSQAAIGEPPQGVARFSLVVDGAELATFSELSGITSGYEVADLELKAGPTPQLKLPGKRKPPTIVLKRGMTQDLTLWAWHEQALADDPSARKNASLVMYNLEGTPIATYTMESAWPAKLEIGALRAGSSEVLMETVTIVGEQLHRVAP